MFSLINVVVIATISLLVGVTIGSLSNRLLSAQGKKNRNLKDQLKTTENQLTEYQQQVTQHFAETAKLINNLTQSYREVHEHLSSDALKLANVDISRQLLDKNRDDKLFGEIEINEDDIEPPRDWSPKTGSDTLSESYGLQEDYTEIAENSKKL